MATGLRLLKVNFPFIFNSALRNTSLNGTACFGINRFIFSESSLGINGYNNTRLQMHQQFSNVESSFRKKMNEIVTNENSVVFTEDLKAMLHLVNKNPEDIKLVLDMMQKFNTQNKELRFGTYVFGPVVMRAFYYLDDPELALNTFFDSKLTYFFDQTMSYAVLMSLLYKHEKYSDLRKVYDVIKTRSIDIQRFPRNALIVVFAGCYKENTPETFQYAVENWRDVTQRGIRPIRRVIAFLSALAIKQNSPGIALEVLTGLKTSRYIDNRCLKIWAYCKLNRLIDVIPLLRQSLENTEDRKENYFSDTIEILEKSIENTDSVVKEEITKLLSALKAGGQVDTNTLEDHLCQPIERSIINRMPIRRTFRQSFNDNAPDQTRRRLGLKDLL